MATATRLWLCDYDIPKEPASARVQFYRIKRRLIHDAIKQDREIRILHSTASVFLTNSATLAENIQALAGDFHASGTHVYQLDWVQEIEEWPT
jgi:hypothetical protein